MQMMIITGQSKLCKTLYLNFSDRNISWKNISRWNMYFSSRVEYFSEYFSAKYFFPKCQIQNPCIPCFLCILSLSLFMADHVHVYLCVSLSFSMADHVCVCLCVFLSLSMDDHVCVCLCVCLCASRCAKGLSTPKTSPQIYNKCFWPLMELLWRKNVMTTDILVIIK